MSEITTLSDVEQLEEIMTASHEKPVLIFKHSLICPISGRAWAQYREFVDSLEAAQVDCALVEIQNARPVSTAIADRTGVRHESPQAILLSAGRAVWNASHSGITARALAEATARA